MEPKLYLNKVVSFSEKKKKDIPVKCFFFFSGKGADREESHQIY